MKHSTTAVLDPICGMTVDPATAAGSSEYDGETYHFCSLACMAKFEAASALYVGTAASCCSAGQSCC